MDNYEFQRRGAPRFLCARYWIAPSRTALEFVVRLVWPGLVSACPCLDGRTRAGLDAVVWIGEGGGVAFALAKVGVYLRCYNHHSSQEVTSVSSGLWTSSVEALAGRGN